MRSGCSLRRCCALVTLLTVSSLATDLGTIATESQAPASRSAEATVARLVSEVRIRAKALENSSGMRLSFQSFTSAYKIAPGSISYSDFVIVRLLYEATRDAGFWNMHWTITNMPPDSDRIWSQWKNVKAVSPITSTASAECDELSALYAFLVERAGVRSVGLFWPYPNHTVAVWVIHPAKGSEVRVVVPTFANLSRCDGLVRNEKVQRVASEDDFRIQAPRRTGQLRTTEAAF